MNSFRRTALILAFLGLISFSERASAQTPLPEATNLWAFKFSGGDTSRSTPAIGPDGTIYVGTFHGKLDAITPQGNLKWQFDANSEIKSSPAIADDGTVYFGSRNRKFYALTPTGKLKWAFSTGAWVDSSPAIAVDGAIYFGGWDKFFYALNPDGSLKWKFPVGGIVESSPAIAADGTIYFGAHDKKFYALNPDGKVLWTFETRGEIISSPAVSTNGTIYFSSLDGNFYALKPAGAELWHCHTGSVQESSPALDEKGNLYLRANSSVISISSDGGKNWEQGSPLWLDETPAVAGGWIYCSKTWRTFGALTTDCHWAWTANLGLSPCLTSSPVVGKNGVIYACSETVLQAFCPLGSAPEPARSPWPMFRANAQHTGRISN
jgi:outer membrane protein assembly factor BamB